MRATLACLLFLAAACSQQEPATKQREKRAEPKPALAVSPMALTAKAVLEKRLREKNAADALEKRVKAAMEIVLIDPFSAEYRALRDGKNGSICGQVNGKNRLGAYVGFKDFVLGKDGKTVWLSRNSDGVETEIYSSFSEAFVNACASKTQIARYRSLTSPPVYYPDFDSYDAASEAADLASETADAAKRAM